MNIKISDLAAAWYEQEMDLSSGDYVRFYVRYGGHSSIQQGFSLGLSNDPPVDLAIKTDKNGIIYYIEEKDIWYFENYNLSIEYNEKKNEPEFIFN